MSPRQRSVFLTLLLSCLAAFLFAADHLIRNHLVIPSFLRLEKHLAQQDLVRCVEAVIGEQNHLSKLVTDWSIWDDTYQFAVDWNSAYKESNLQPETLATVGIHMIMFISGDKVVKLAKTMNPLTGEELPEQAIPDRELPQEHAFIRTGHGKARRSMGIVLTHYGPLLVAAHQILPSEGDGEPRGTLVMGRFLNEGVMGELKRQTQISFTVKTRDMQDLTEIERSLLASNSSPVMLDTSAPDGLLHGFTSMTDIWNRPALVIHARLPRELYQRGVETARLISWTLLCSGLIIGCSCVAIFIIYRRNVHAHRDRMEALIKERTAELTESDARYKALVEAASEGIAIIQEGVCLDLNGRAQEMFGYGAEEVVGRPLTDLIAPGVRHMVQKRIVEGYGRPFETLGLRRDDSTFPLSIQERSIVVDQRTIRAATFQDLTEKKLEEEERKKLEKRLERSEKMESIGLMAGGVAHDLNNILSGIVTYPELILLNLPPESSIRRPIEEIQKAGRRAAEVVADLLTVARGIAMVMTPIDINAIVREYLTSPEYAMLRRLHPHVEVISRLDPEIPSILGSTVHIAKSLMNLVTNGAEAINGLGAIAISTCRERIGEGQVQASGLSEGEYVVLSVQDNGPGIAPQDLAHIFEPFYSRKITSRSGTGLGLAVVWNTLQDHKGTVSVTSNDKGSLFRLYFPASEQVAVSAATEMTMTDLQGHFETILVVDDDSQQLEIAEQLLAALHYTPRLANSGEAALAALQQEPASLVILDMIMSGMNGLETYRRILEIFPGQKALIASGFSENVDVQRARELGALAFVRKPYSIGEIGGAIKMALAG